MATHVKVLGVLYIALSAIGVATALFLMLAVGTASSIVGLNADPGDAAVALPIIGIAGSALVIFLLSLSLPGLIVGIGLLKLASWARIAGIVLAIIHLINIPIGTVLGIYALWVLFNKDTERLFDGGTVPAVQVHILHFGWWMPSHTSTTQWPSFETRMRRRCAALLTLRAAIAAAERVVDRDS